MHRSSCLLACAISFVGLGCGDDSGGVLTTTDTDGGTGGDPSTTSTTSTTSTSTDTGDPESDAVGPCNPVVDGAGSFTPAPFVIGEVDLAEVCNDDLLGAVDIAQLEPATGSDVLRVQDPNPNAPVNNDNFDVLVYGPETTTPLSDPLPLFVFMPGNGQFSYDRDEEEELYAHMAALVEDGYIAMFINPRDGQLPSGKRWRMQLCTLVWAATPGPDGWDPPRDGQGTPLYTSSGEVVLAGHSRGGGGTLLFTNQFENFTQGITLMQDYELCGAVTMAPIWAAQSIGDLTATDITLPDAKAVPWLTLAGAYDEDLPAEGLKQFDAIVPEDALTLARSSACSGPNPPAGCSDFNTWDKVLALGYGITHNSWGGTNGVGDSTSSQSRARGQAAGPALIRSFLRWQMMGIDVQDSRDLFMLLIVRSACSQGFRYSGDDARRRR